MRSLNRFQKLQEALQRFERDGDYAFATGRLAVCAGRELPFDRFRAVLASSEPLAQLNTLLTESAYPEAETIEERLDLAYEANDRLLKELTQNGALAEVLLFEEDVHNLKLMLKALRYGEKSDEAELPAEFSKLLFRESYHSSEALWKALLATLASKQMPMRGPVALLRQALKEQSYWAQDYREQSLDWRLDAYRFEAWQNMAEACEQKGLRRFLMAYVALQADLANVQVALRLLQAEATLDLFSEALVPAGLLKREELEEAYSGGKETFLTYLEKSDLADLVEPARVFLQNGQSQALSLQLFNFQIRLARLGLHDGFSAMKLAGAWMAKRFEIQNLRLLMAILQKGDLSEADLALLRPTYRGA